MDGVGNISEPYYLGNNTNKQYQWWLVKNKDPGTVTITDTSNATPAFTANGSYELNVSLDSGVQIEKITAENATVKKVEFVGYDGTRWSGTAQPTYNKDGENAGYFDNKELWVNVAGLKVTLDVIQDWTAKTVNLKINDAAPVKVFDIEAKTLSKDDVEIGTATWSATESSYTISITLKNDAVPGNITKITSDKCTVTGPVWSTQSANATGTITLSGLPAKDWSSQTITLTVNDNTNITQDVLTIPATLPEEIEIGTKEWVENQTTYSIPVTLKNGAVPGNITSVSSTVGTASNNINWNDDNKTGTITLSYVPAKDWIDQVVTIKLNDRDDLKKDVFTIPAITAYDITLNGATYDTVNRGDSSKVENVQTVYPVKITVPGNRTIKDVTATGTDDFNWISDTSTAKITVKPDWEEKNVSLTIYWEKDDESGSFTKEVFKVPQIVMKETSVKIEQDTTDPNKRTIAFTIPGDRNISDLKLIYSDGAEVPETIATFASDDNGKRSGTITFTPQLVAKNISVQLNNNDSFIYTIGAIPIRSLENSDLEISCNPGTWSAETTGYSVTIGIKDGSPLSLITGVTALGVEGINCTTWNSTNGTVTLSNINQKWDSQEVFIKVNELENVKVLDVPHKKLNSAHIKLEPDSWTSEKTEYLVQVNLKDGETDLDAKYLDGMTFSANSEDSGVSTENSSVTFDKTNSKLTITGISITQNWSNQTVKVSISGDYVEDTVTLPAIYIAAKSLAEGNIFINAINSKTWNGTDTEYELPITFDESGAGIGNVSSIEIDTDNTTATGVTAEWSENSDTVKIMNLPAQNWSDQKVFLKINETISKEVFTIPCKSLTAEDIESIDEADTSGENPTVAITLKGGASHLALLRAGVSAKCGDTPITATLSESDDVVTLSNIPAATWTAQTITLTVGSGLMSKEVMSVDAKQLTAEDIILSGNTWSENGGITITIKIPKAVTITSVESGSDNVTLTWANNSWTESDYSVTNVTPTFTKGDTAAYAVIKVNNVPKNVFIVPGTDGSTTVGASNNNQRSIFGFRTKGNTYSATSTSSSTAGEAPKTRSVSLSSWVNDVFNGGSDAAVEAVKDEVKASAKKASKKSKKSAKAKSQKVVEKPVAAEHAEVAAVSLAETSVAPVNELAETVAATVSAVTDVVEKAAPAVDEVSASLEAEAVAPLSADPDLPDASVESPSASTAAIILAIAALCTAAAALTIIALKKRATKK